MMGLAVIAALLMLGYGFAAAGVLGSLTGLIATVGIGSGLAIATAEPATGVSMIPAIRRAQRIGGFLAALGYCAGSYHGGWSWGTGGFLSGIVGGILITAITRPRRTGTFL
jgi:hypothetical protein